MEPFKRSGEFLRRCVAVVASLWCLAAPLQAAEEAADLLTRATELARRAEPAVVAQMGRMLLSRTWAGQPGRALQSALPLQRGELVHLLDVGGAVVFSNDPYLTTRSGYRFPGSEQLARRELFQRALAENRGVGSYRAMSLGGTEIVRRELAWVDATGLDRAWVLIYERENLVTSHYSDEPLTGKWLGAYSMKGTMLFSEGADLEQWQDAGQISALLMQSGAQCAARLVSTRWQMEAAGLVVSNQISLGEVRVVPHADDELWMLTGSYDPDLDQIRAQVTVVGPRVVTERSIFLERYRDP